MSDHKLTDDQIAQYLQTHPEFFVRHPELLHELRLPHESGNAISLVEKQVSVLRERNMDMRHRLSKLLDNARDNDRLFDKTKRLVLALLESQSLDDTINTLHHSFTTDFKIHYTSVMLFDDPERLLSDSAQVVSINDAHQHIGKILKNNKPMCGVFTAQESAFLFPEFDSSVGSIALVPLIYGNTYGLLAIANRDPNYYRSSMGTLFLSYIGEVLNRLLPKHIHAK